MIALLVGGVLIVTSGLMGSLMMGAWSSTWGSGMMGPYSMGDGWLEGMAWWMAGVSLLTGAAVLVASFRISRGDRATEWGVVAIVAGALSLFAMGGWLVGAIAAIFGGALAMSDARPKAAGVEQA